MFADPTPALPLIKEGKVRALGISSLTRAASAPDIAPISESGVPGFEAVGRLMIVAPARTPAPVISQLHAELKKIAAMPDIEQWIGRNGLIPALSPAPEDIQTSIRSEMVHWGKIILQIGLAGSQ